MDAWVPYSHQFASSCQASLVFKDAHGMKTIGGLVDFKEAAQRTARVWRTVASYRREWKALLNNLVAGDYRPVVTRGVLFGDAATRSPSR